MRDKVGDICNIVFKNVYKVPVIREADDSAGALVVDLNVRGMWQAQMDHQIDLRVIDTDAPSVEWQ